MNIGNSGHILPDYIFTRRKDDEDDDYDLDDLEDSLDEEDRVRGSLYVERGYIVRAPVLVS